MNTILFVIIMTLAFGCAVSNNEFVEMKIVDEPSSLGFHHNVAGNHEELLKLRVKPSNFSGPPHFKRLVGRCFHSVLDSYKYSFCPFDNITQHEQNSNWNPYNGVLGVWQEWEIENNTFTAMMFKNGDQCGSIYRSVKVIFLCGNSSQIVNVTEPNRCSYEMKLTTPLVCAKDSMLVYPTLNQTLQREWDLLEGELASGDLTDKGYKNRLKEIFEKANLMVSPSKQQPIREEDTINTSYHSDFKFENLDTCNTAYKVVKEQNNALKYQLQVLQHPGGN